jgi:hypothetical protein
MVYAFPARYSILSRGANVKSRTVFFLVFLFIAWSILIPPRSYGMDDTEQLVLGNHVLTLQWLRNNNGIGKARIFKKDGKICIDGYQSERYEGELNYMSIQGTLRVVNPKELEFTGKIVTRISYINSGIPHERSGTFRLQARGARKYWRMQNMTQPDGEHQVTDYIDIFFEKFRRR